MSNRTKRFSYTAGEKGRNRVRVYAEAKTGIIYLEYHEKRPGQSSKRRRKSLGHRDEERAKQQAEEVALKISKHEWDSSTPVTLQELFDIYLNEVTPQKSKHTQAHDRRAVRMFTLFYGANQQVAALNRRHWDRFIQARRSGRIGPKGMGSGDGVGNRQIAQDLKFLRAVFNWATVAGHDSGDPLLRRNPFDGFPYPKETSPKRPIMSQTRYEKMLAVANDVDWRFTVALQLAHETGHRIGAIRQLSWSDVDLNAGEINWPADTDKIGWAHTTPTTKAARAAFRRARSEKPGVGKLWVLPAPRNESEPCSRHVMRDWWLKAEKVAGLRHVDQMGWHSLRRKFATDLKNQGVPLKDICYLGGWKDEQTLLKCYQKADEKTMRNALEERSQKLAAAGR